MQTTVPPAVLELVERFKTHSDAYRGGHYNETQVRREFLDPFFEALGWDVNNRQGHAEAYKDVVHEDSIRIEGATKAPDYAFRVGGARRFFVEAKKPSVNIYEGIPAAYQLRRYAWSAKLPLSILTDFEELAVYDCRGKPSRADKPATGRILYMGYREYPARWNEIASVFSREAVSSGSFDQYAETTRSKHGTAEVDDAFLEEISRWRELLARNIALRNPSLTQRELNYAVQMTIDRVIFLRICEDRGIEFYGQLMALLNGGEVYPRMAQVFHKADARYDSGLFHFHDEKGQSEAPDRLTPSLSIDDAPLKDLLRNVYYPDSPYAFQVLPADILGQVYEQFLGKVIRLTEGHRAVVEDKPEVKKAGGVFYTPTYIVDYIVRSTVGRLLEGRSPGDKGVGKGTPLRVLDPACGSGSFLLGAYQYLLDWYRDGYIAAGPEKALKSKTPALYQAANNEWRLTTAERKRILLDHIYGVDIDPQAVEVTKLSLLLKVLEGESEETLGSQLRLFQERALPNLGRNIQCGNSLIGPDFYDGAQGSLLDEAEQYRVNAFDWQGSFAEVFKTSGGFDAVIGNPPYGALFEKKEDGYFGINYATFGGIKDVFTCFIEKGLHLTSNRGKLSFIIPSAWLGGPQSIDLRKFLLGFQIDRIILLPFDIFSDAYIDTLIIAITKNLPIQDSTVSTFSYPKKEKLTQIKLDNNNYKVIKQIQWETTEDKKFILDPETIYIMNALRSKCPTSFLDVSEIKRGVLFDKSLLRNSQKTSQYFPYFEGDVYRYIINMKADSWVEFGDKMKERPKDFSWFTGERILLRRLVNRRQRLMACLTDKTFITNKNLYSVKVRRVNIKVFLGILNSKLVSFMYINQVTQAVKDDFPQVTIKDVLSLPFPSLEAISKHEDIFASLVSKIMEYEVQLAAARTPNESAMLQRQAEAADRQIDRLVYELYGLSEQEIKIVEG